MLDVPTFSLRSVAMYFAWFTREYCGNCCPGPGDSCDGGGGGVRDGGGGAVAVVVVLAVVVVVVVKFKFDKSS